MSANVADWLRRLGRQGQSGEWITADETRRVICWRPFREFLIPPIWRPQRRCSTRWRHGRARFEASLREAPQDEATH